MRYNYIFFAPTHFSLHSFRDIIDMGNVHFYSSYTQNIKSKLLQRIVRINFSEKINRIKKNPFSLFINPILFDTSFEEDKPICFVFVGQAWYLYNSSYIDYVRRKFPDAKIALYMQDLVSANKHLDVDLAKHKFDCLISYDEGDAKNYNMHYFPTPYPNYIVEDNALIEPSDVYFCGKAKSDVRYRAIMDVFEVCKKNGLKTDFNISGLPVEKQIKADGIKYNVSMTYEENLQHVKKTKCILEAMQDSAFGFTPRLWESIVYEKHLLTNNKSISSSKYNFSNVHFIQDGFDDLKRMISQPVNISNNVKDSLSAKNFIMFIDRLL